MRGIHHDSLTSDGIKNHGHVWDLKKNTVVADAGTGTAKDPPCTHRQTRDGHITGDRVVSSTGSREGTFTQDVPGAWSCQMMIFKGI